MTKKIKVLIVDDSAIVRSVLNERLSTFDDIEVIGVAPDAYVARTKILKLKPDVITLDIEMPRMDGLTFLSKLMAYNPMPVIIVSSVTTRDSNAAIKAMEIGAFDVVNKPNNEFSVDDVIDDIVFKIRQANSVKDTYITNEEAVKKSIANKKVVFDSDILSTISTTDKMIAIGSSTGGTIALEYILKSLPLNMPPILITQHMPPKFTYQFARRLNDISALTVKEAENGDAIMPGHAYIAQGGFHLIVKRKGSMLYTHLDDGEKINFQKPAVDVMFHSIAKTVGVNTFALLLTGMGKDGAKGMLELKEKGAYTIAQDEKSSVVWGMPKTAIDIDAHKEILALKDIPKRIVDLVHN